MKTKIYCNTWVSQKFCSILVVVQVCVVLHIDLRPGRAVKEEMHLCK